MHRIQSKEYFAQKTKHKIKFIENNAQDRQVKYLSQLRRDLAIFFIGFVQPTRSQDFIATDGVKHQCFLELPNLHVWPRVHSRCHHFSSGFQELQPNVKLALPATTYCCAVCLASFCVLLFWLHSVLLKKLHQVCTSVLPWRALCTPVLAGPVCSNPCVGRGTVLCGTQPGTVRHSAVKCLLIIKSSPVSSLPGGPGFTPDV